MEEKSKCTPQMLASAIELGLQCAWRTKSLIDDIPALSYKAKYSAESLLEMAYKLGIVKTAEPQDIVKTMEDLGTVRFAINGEIKTYYIWNLVNVNYGENDNHTLYILPNLTAIQDFLNDYERITNEYKLTLEFAKYCCDDPATDLPKHLAEALSVGGWTSENCKALGNVYELDADVMNKICAGLAKVEKSHAEISEE